MERSLAGWPAVQEIRLAGARHQSASSPQDVQLLPHPTTVAQRQMPSSAGISVNDRRSSITRGEFAAYSGGNAPFSQLLVLDLTDHSDGVPALPDLAWVREHRARPDASPQHVVVAVVVGNRLQPRQLSDARTPATRRRAARQGGPLAPSDAAGPDAAVQER